MSRVLLLALLSGCESLHAAPPVVMPEFTRVEDCANHLEAHLSVGCTVVFVKAPTRCSNCADEVVMACPPGQATRIQRMFSPPEGYTGGTGEIWSGPCNPYEHYRVGP